MAEPEEIPRGGEAFAEFDALFRHAPFGVALFDRALRYVRVNEALAVLNGQPVEMHIGKTPQDVLPAYGVAVEAQVQEVFERGTPSEAFQAELEPPGKPGERVMMRVRFFPVEQDGRITHVGATLADVTSERRADAQTLASERQLRQVIEASPGGLVMVDGAGRIVLVNQQIERLFGYNRDELLGQSVDVLVPEGLRGAHGPARTHYAQAPDARAMGHGHDLAGWRKDGTHFPIEVGLTPVETPEGPAVLATVTDITERRRTEEALSTSASEARRLALVAARTTNGVVMTNDDGRVEWVNEAFVKLTGFTLDELRGHRPADLLQSPDSDDETTEHVRDSVMARRPFAAEILNRRKDGQPFWVRVEATPLFEGDTFTGYITIQTDVTERKLSDQALRESEERYRTFLALSQEGVYRFEADVPISTALSPYEQAERFLRGARLAECNDAFARMYGYERAEELVGTRLDRFLDPAESRTGAFLSAFVEEGYQLSDAESFEHDREGRMRVFANDLVGIVEDGHLVRAWGTQRDVTLRVVAESARRESEAALQLALDVAKMGTWTIDLPGQAIRRSASTDRLFGLPADGAPRTVDDFLAFVMPEDRVRVERMLRGAVRGGGAVTEEFRVVRADGEERWLSARGALERDAAGRAARFVGAFVDVTAEQEAAEALRASEERLRLALEGGSMGTWDWDLTTDALHVDEREADLLGVDPAAIPTTTAFFDLVMEEDREGLRAALTAAQERGHDYTHEFRIFRPDGEIRWLAGRGRVLREGDGRAVRMFGLNFDISERRRAEEELKRRTREMEQFTYTVSHDLKSPIVTVNGFLGLLESHIEAGRVEEAKSAAVRIRRAADRMSRLTDDLLELSRIGRVTGKRTVVDVEEIVTELAAGLGPQVEAHGCTVEIQSHLPAVRADARRLTEAFDNLLTNAVKYACPAGATRIVVSAEEGEGEFRYVVADDGPGIDASHHERIFELFQRNHSGPDGSGMGLAIVRKIMEVHGGSARVESAPGEGSRFVLAFPRRARVGPAAVTP